MPTVLRCCVLLVVLLLPATVFAQASLTGTVRDASGAVLPGVTVAGLTTESRRKLRLDAAVEGLQITDVTEASDYSSKLKEGMVVTRINSDPVTDLSKAKKSLQKGINRFYVSVAGRITVIAIEVK